jgi:tRNA nucleotidyltransferase (CCA-adding enzyme)
MDDLRRGLIRILHERSFTDDATRIWRALRYEQRLGFSIETATLELLKRDLSMLDTINGDRIRHELELVLKETYPEKFFLRADELQVLSRLQPSLKFDSGLSDRFEQARQASSPNQPPAGLYLALLTYHLTGEQVEQLIERLKLSRTLAQTLWDTCKLKTEIKPLGAADLKPSRIYSMLHGYTPVAITATSLASDSPEVKGSIDRYLTRLRYVKTSLNGKDLKKMGLVSGPRISEILNRLRVARLDGEVSNRQEEERLASDWLRKDA